ncbi:hypothetical protein MTR_8g064060 [Medicago truncatula]|uniref:Uncharacterized protein n=1 Tax=Medicago truncatula TaxID=3880 RepID=A0A072TRF4_MEDTR|nr:hypothetical protein MTR_8g064060 [Medicago truncatula]
MVENCRKSEFQEWMNSNDHLYLSTRGASFTWSNGRRENLKLLKNNLKDLNKIKVAASNTESIQNQISTIGFSDSLMDQEKLAMIEFDKAVKFEE